MVEVLIQNGADWHAQGDEPLIRAARNGFTEIVKLLLKAGEQLRISRDEAWREAVSNGHTDVARILIDYDAGRS
jgi:ankyrin repeat protein